MHRHSPHNPHAGHCRHRHRHHGFGGPDPGGEDFGDFPFGGGGPGFGRGGGPRRRGGRKARRGDIRTAALLLLAEEPRNGYQIMQEVQERSDGAWRPSPGSVYPALAQLEDEGLIRAEEIERRKAYRLTVEGLAQVEQRDPEQVAPWEQMSDDRAPQALALGKTMREVAIAFTQVIRTGSDEQHEQARKALADVRRELYRILGEGGEASQR